MPDFVSCRVQTGIYNFQKEDVKAEFDRVRGKTSGTPSGYPHEFQNFGGGISWDDQACNSDKVKTFEFPVFQRQGGRDPQKYNENSKPKDEPGPCRVVFSEHDGHLCGVMCHRSMTPGQDQSFVKCGPYNG
ncbi:Ribonuclease/ribotoxin [Xylariaceae sp. FL0662B]|nr:Ribonuclease/ribotoxin [Xylariaceae sp. FL0662B]